MVNVLIPVESYQNLIAMIADSYHETILILRTVIGCEIMAKAKIQFQKRLQPV